MHRSAALGVVKAATRLKILAQRHARERADAEAAAGLLAEHSENGFARDSEGELPKRGSVQTFQRVGQLLQLGRPTPVSQPCRATPLPTCM